MIEVEVSEHRLKRDQIRESIDEILNQASLFNRN